jgi:beta-glucosidase
MSTSFSLADHLLLGTATASLQIEGGDTNNTWYRFCEEGRTKDGTHCIVACDHWNRLEEDVALLEELGCHTYRMSLEWSRIEPAEGRFDEEAIAHYRRELELLHSRGIRPLVTLHHFSNPLWLADSGDWEHPSVVDRFLRYTERVVAAFGDIVSDWVTINEPSVYVAYGYLFGLWPPLRRDLGAASRCSQNMARAHAEAYHLIHRVRRAALEAAGGVGDDGGGAPGNYSGDAVEAGPAPATPTGPAHQGPGGDGNSPAEVEPTRVGAAHHLRVFEPWRSHHPLDRLSAVLYDRVAQETFVRAMTEGANHPPLIGLDLPAARNGDGFLVDFFGINYYSRDLLRFRFRPKNLFGERRVKPGAPTNDLGWEIYPEGLYRLARRYWERYRLPVFITENGTADAADAFRREFIASHLAQVARAIADGVDIRRYYHWSLIDNFEWQDGLTPRFGLAEVDYETQRRTVRPSGRYFAELCRRRASSSAAPIIR